ncbi:MAG: glycosyltransferase [Verrucomicrobiota bacterium]|nr:glycosyltransferase [Verrucomicrobiota bacterium]
MTISEKQISLITVDIVIINYNTPELVENAIRSIRDNSTIDTIITVVDNGSTDNSCEYIRNHCKDVSLIEMGYNSGFATAVNAGVNQVNSDIVFIMNSDIELKNNVITIVIDKLLSDIDAVLACPKLLNEDGSLQAAVVPTPNLFTELTNRSLARKRLNTDMIQTSSVDSVVGPCMAVKTKEFHKLNGFDEDFFFFFEETDFCKRIKDSNKKILFVPEAKLVHFQGKSADKTPAAARIQFNLSRYHYFMKHFGIMQSLILFLGCFIRLFFNISGTFLIAVIMPFKKKYRSKLSTYIILWIWHLLLLIPKWGMNKK